MIVRPYKGSTDRYVSRCKYQREHGDEMLSAFLFLLGVGFLIALGTAL